MNLVILLIWVICLRLVNTYIQIYIQLYFIQKLSFVYYLAYWAFFEVKSLALYPYYFPFLISESLTLVALTTRIRTITSNN